MPEDGVAPEEVGQREGDRRPEVAGAHVQHPAWGARPPRTEAPEQKNQWVINQ